MAKEVVQGQSVGVVAAGSVVPMVARYVLEPLDLVAMDTPGSSANAANLARAP
jgi:hypothetical protein